MPVYLTAAVVALGLAAYLASFGPLLTINTDIGPFGGAEFTASGLSYWTVAGAARGPAGRGQPASQGARAAESRTFTAVTAVTAVLAVLLVIAQVINRPQGFSIGWALWLVLAVHAAAGRRRGGRAAVRDRSAQRARAPAALPAAVRAVRAPPADYYGPVCPRAVSARAIRTQYGGYPPAGQRSARQPQTDTPPTGFPSYSPQPAAQPSSPGAGLRVGPGRDAVLTASVPLA